MSSSRPRREIDSPKFVDPVGLLAAPPRNPSKTKIYKCLPRGPAAKSIPQSDSLAYSLPWIRHCRGSPRLRRGIDMLIKCPRLGGLRLMVGCKKPVAHKHARARHGRRVRLGKSHSGHGYGLNPLFFLAQLSGVREYGLP
jgi:hypothetical protein